ncbi:MAG TPA: thiamine ABC transporter substrate-binding protein [Bdellovibrionota bacterium]|nr:thiamine ABC transporter substrate-binding protein [Bdellovibrionota bacterium]
MFATAAALVTLTVGVYDTLSAPGGWGAAVFPAFEKRCGCRLKILPSGDAGQMVARASLDAKRGHRSMDVLVGVDQDLWAEVKPLADGSGWKPYGFELLRQDLGAEPGLVPFDYGVFAFMADTQALAKLRLKAPASLKDLAKPEFHHRFILEDPRTSSPGLALLLHTRDLWGDRGAIAFWRELAGQWLAMPAGWDAAYGLFTDGKAPLVWSYTTSQAYHELHGDTAGRYQALRFEEGHPIQVEGAVILKDLPEARRDLARRLVEFLISGEAQEKIPATNWMFPAREGIPIPPSFRKVVGFKTLTPKGEPGHAVPDAPMPVDALLRSWRQAVER